MGQYSEEDVKLKFITPAIICKWDKMKQVTMEYSFTDGRVIVRGNLTSRGNPTILVLNKIAKALETDVTILTDVNYNAADTRKSLINLIYSLNQKQLKILNDVVSLLCEHPYQFWEKIKNVLMKEYEKRINEIGIWEFHSKKNSNEK